MYSVIGSSNFFVFVFLVFVYLSSFSFVYLCKMRAVGNVLLRAGRMMVGQAALCIQ